MVFNIGSACRVRQWSLILGQLVELGSDLNIGLACRLRQWSLI